MKIVDTKAVVEECAATQHKMLVSTIIVRTEWRFLKVVEKIKWWKLKDRNMKNEFKTEVIDSGILGGQQDWQKVTEKIRSIARMELGKTSGKANSLTHQINETWWWNQEVQEKFKDKRKAKKYGIPPD